jgi:hypothetical protein
VGPSSDPAPSDPTHHRAKLASTPYPPKVETESFRWLHNTRCFVLPPSPQRKSRIGGQRSGQHFPYSAGKQVPSLYSRSLNGSLLQPFPPPARQNHCSCLLCSMAKQTNINIQNEWHFQRASGADGGILIHGHGLRPKSGEEPSTLC